MTRQIIIKCPNCQAAYRLTARSTPARVRCKLCRTTFRPPPPPSSYKPDFEDTVLNWLLEADAAEAKTIKRPRIISSRAEPLETPPQPTPAQELRTAPSGSS
jgi:predicted Zn finger-like uncharacterized protein